MDIYHLFYIAISIAILSIVSAISVIAVSKRKEIKLQNMERDLKLKAEELIRKEEELKLAEMDLIRREEDFMFAMSAFDKINNATLFPETVKDRLGIYEYHLDVKYDGHMFWSPFITLSGQHIFRKDEHDIIESLRGCVEKSEFRWQLDAFMHLGWITREEIRRKP